MLKFLFFHRSPMHKMNAFKSTLEVTLSNFNVSIRLCRKKQWGSRSSGHNSFEIALRDINVHHTAFAQNQAFEVFTSMAIRKVVILHHVKH